MDLVDRPQTRRMGPLLRTTEQVRECLLPGAARRRDHVDVVKKRQQWHAYTNSAYQRSRNKPTFCGSRESAHCGTTPTHFSAHHRVVGSLSGPESRAERCPTRAAIWPRHGPGSSPFFLKKFGGVSQDTAWAIKLLKWPNRSGDASPSATQHALILGQSRIKFES